MKKTLFFFITLISVAFYAYPSFAQSNVIINEFSQGDANGLQDHEWIELVVTANSTNLGGLYITTTSAYTAKYGGLAHFPSSADLTIGFQLTADPIFSGLSKGDVIVIYKSPTNTNVTYPTSEYDPALGGTPLNTDGSAPAPTTDVNFGDGNGILIASNNSTYITGVWPGMKNYTNTPAGDNIGIFATSPSFTGVFGISYGNGTNLPDNPINGNYGTVTLQTTTNLTSGQEIAFTGSDPFTANGYANWTQQSSTKASPKLLNGGFNNSLPVELMSFSASVSNGNTVQLTWSTATEVNNYGFDVERSSGNSGWQKIGFVAGAGNSNSPKDYSFTDNPSGGTSFSYRLKQIDVAGSFKYYDAVTVNLTLSDEPQLLQNSPNPFNPSTSIKFYIPNNSDVSIKIYDVLGREVTTLVNQQTTAGYHIVYWNGKDSRGEDVSSGIYLYRLTAGSFSQTKKMNLLK
jgi:FlgD Ig-like domain